MLKTHRRSERKGTLRKKMAAVKEDYFFGDDLEAILSAIDDNILDENEEFTSEINAVVEEIGDHPPSSGFSCDLCDKVCKTQRGLTRHRNSKHKTANVEGYLDQDHFDEFIAENRLHPFHFKKYIEESASKLSVDECYSEDTRKEFVDFKISLDDARFTYEHVKDIIANFNGNAEKFYPLFYKAVSAETIFKNLTKRSSILLGFEVANRVLSHLTCSAIKESSVDLVSDILFTKKELNIINYLSGYVFGTFYRRIRTSKSSQSMFGSQSLQILLAGKSEVPSSDNMLTQAKDRGGLWRVTIQVFQIFRNVESYFRRSTVVISKKIDSKKMVSDLLKNPSILCNYNVLRNQAAEKVSKEVAINLLEHLIMLYIRVRIFSLVKDKRELHKIESKKKKMRSLRTEIKKASSSMDQGH